MSNELYEIQQITHEYRKSLAAYEARTGRAPQTVDHRGSGEEREKFAKMDADLTSAELIAQNKALEARLAKLEAQPVLESRVSQRADRASGDEYAHRWLNAMMGGRMQELRAQSALGTDSSGAAIPTDMERRIVELMYQTNVIRQIAVVNTIDSKRKIAVESALPTTYKVAESAGDPGTGTAATLSYPTFGTQISVDPTLYVTAVKMSLEFIQDSIGANGIGSALDYVARKCAMSMAMKHEEQFTIGDGSGDPQGIALNGLITQVEDLGSTAALSTLTADNIINAVHKVNPAYRNSPRFRWLFSDEFLKTARKLKTTLAGTSTAGYTDQSYIWTPGSNTVNSLNGGVPATIYGVPYSISPYVPSVSPTGSGASGAIANGDVYAVVGDFNYFEIFDRTGIESMVDPYSNALNRQTTLYVYSRTDSRCMNKAAFAAITA